MREPVGLVIRFEDGEDTGAFSGLGVGWLLMARPTYADSGIRQAK